MITLAALFAVALVPGPAAAVGARAFRFEFVGTDAQCGGPGTAGSRIVTGQWMIGLGLPDNILINNDDTTTAAKRDLRYGLLLSKNGLTTNCSAPGASIAGFFEHTVTASSEFGFDYRNGTHCGNGAPRFNVTVVGSPTVHFGGCAFGEHTPAPQDPLQWTRVRLGIGDFFPAIPDGAEIDSIDIVYDEGTDTTSTPDDPNGVGLSIIDNIFVNGALVTKQ